MNFKEKIKNLSPERLNLLLKGVQKSESEITGISVDRNRPFFPLSHGQKRLWFQAEIERNKSAYNIPLALCVKLRRPLDLHHLESVVNSIIHRNEILRTTFHMRDGHPVQSINPALRVGVRYEDLRNSPLSEPKQKSIELATIEAKQSFDLENGPLIRFSVFQIDHLEYIFVTVTHHLISDGWSNNLFFLELAKGLFFISEKTKTQQYLEFIFWEEKRFQKPYLDNALLFWRDYLSGELPVTKFPQEFLGNRAEEPKGVQKVFFVNSELSQKIKDFSRTNRTTLFVTFLAVFNVLLARYTGENDLLIGLPHANRNLPEFQRAFGIFINLIPFRTRVNNEDSFLNYLQEVDQLVKKIFAYGDIPFNYLVENLKPTRTLGNDPFFQILFVHQNFPHAYAELPEVQVTPITIDNGHAQYALTFIVEEVQEEIFVKIKYKENIFDSFFVDKIFEHYINLLHSVTENSHQPIFLIPFLSREEKSWLLAKASHKESLAMNRDESQNMSFCKTFEMQAHKTPQAIALEYLGRSLTYAELNQKANQLANFIKRFKLPLEASVGVFLGRSDLLIIALLGILKSGAAFVPIDNTIPRERILYFLQDAKISLIISESCYLSALAGFDLPVILLDREAQRIEQEDAQDISPNFSNANLAYIIFTSGSTGKPKGVCVEHGQLTAYIESIHHETKAFELTRFGFTSTIAADMGYTNIFLPLAKGRTVVIVPKEISDDPDLLSSFLDMHPVECLKFVPSQLVFLVKAQNPRNILPKKLLILAGEVTPYSLIEKVKQLNPECRVILSYGPTETTVGVMTHQVVNQNTAEGNAPLGQPNLNNEVYLLDAKMELVPIGVPGEIYIGGKTVSRGYFNKLELTTQNFLPNPFTRSRGTKLYKTGDKARYLKNGDIEFLGRKDRQVKIRGYRIELGEIEAAFNKIAEVAQAIVMAIDTGHSRELTAFVLLKRTKSASEMDLKRGLEGWLPSYMIPLQIVILDQLPLTPSGKIDFQTLYRCSFVRNKKTRQVPRDSLELTLLKIWEEVLKVKDLDVGDNFFDLGGHSFLALDLMLKIEQSFGIRMPLAILFESNTIQLLAERIRQKSISFYQQPLVTIRTGTKDPSFFFVHPSGGQVLCYYDLAKSMKGDITFYGLQAPFMEEHALEDHDEIVKISSKYHRSIEAVLPEKGRIVFGGWSLGGLIALEMARQNFEKDTREPLVVILDQPASSNFGEASTSDDTGYLMRFLSQVEDFNEIKFGIEYEHLTGRPFQDQSSLIYTNLKGKNVLPRNVNVEDFSKFLMLQKIQSAASLKYEPQKYQGPVLLIRAENSKWGTDKISSSLGWGKIATNLTVKWVTGSHITMMRHPNVNKISEAINEWLCHFYPS